MSEDYLNQQEDTLENNSVICHPVMIKCIRKVLRKEY